MSEMKQKNNLYKWHLNQADLKKKIVENNYFLMKSNE